RSSIPSRSGCSSRAKTSCFFSRRCRPITLPERCASRKRRIWRLLPDPQNLSKRICHFQVGEGASRKGEGRVDLLGELPVVGEGELELARRQSQLLLRLPVVLLQVLPRLDDFPYVERRPHHPGSAPVVASAKGQARI